MSDIDTVWNNTVGRGDVVLSGFDLENGRDLMTALLNSLFSDDTARASDVIPDGSEDRRGWWGTQGESPTLGSLLWLLDRSKLTPEVAVKAREFAAMALQWMIDDGVVAGFVFSTEIRLPETLILTIQAYRSLADKVAKNFAWTWKGAAIYPAAPASGGGFPVSSLSTEDGLVLVTEDGRILTADTQPSDGPQIVTETGIILGTQDGAVITA